MNRWTRRNVGWRLISAVVFASATVEAAFGVAFALSAAAEGAGGDDLCRDQSLTDPVVELDVGL
jgi:hypothetical protein